MDSAVRAVDAPNTASATRVQPRATRRADLFWHGLTALAFAAVVALLFVKPAHATPAGMSGTWRVVLAHPCVKAKRDFDATVSRLLAERACEDGEPCGIRTRDLLIKSQLLYRLS